MTKKLVKLLALASTALLCMPSQAQADTQAPYPAMAPMEQYMIPDAASEVALARSAAPASISNAADVLVLVKQGYTTAAKGTNGFVCVVERSWSAATTDPEFWNPKVRSPICFNPAAARTFLPIYLMKTKLVLAGKSKEKILEATDTAFLQGKLKPLEPGAMCYMMSKEQYLNDSGGHWRPHLVFFVSGDAARSWGADLPGVPVISASDPEERVTIFMVRVSKWSDGSPVHWVHRGRYEM